MATSQLWRRSRFREGQISGVACLWDRALQLSHWLSSHRFCHASAGPWLKSMWRRCKNSQRYARGPAIWTAFASRRFRLCIQSQKLPGFGTLHHTAHGYTYYLESFQQYVPDIAFPPTAGKLMRGPLSTELKLLTHHKPFS